MNVLSNYVKKIHVDTLFNHHSVVDPHMTFTMQFLGNDGSIALLDTRYHPNEDHLIKTAVYR